MHSNESTGWGHRAPAEPAPSGLRAQLSRGVRLTGTSLRVLVQDPQLLTLPFLALIMTGFVWLLVALSFWALGFPRIPADTPILYQELFLAYLVSYFLSVYFMAAIFGAAYRRIEAVRPTISDGFRAANACLLRLLAWSLFAATFGLGLRLASLRWEQAGRIQARLLGNPWPISSLFVVPLMVVEDDGPVRAFRASRHLIRERWGSHPNGVLGTGVVFLLLFSLGFVPFLYGLLLDPTATFEVVAVVYWLVLSVLWSVVHGILVATLYHYATESSAAFHFNWQALNHPWVR